MSDGHFNRAFLPHTEFRNGFRAAQTRTKILAVEAFKNTIQSRFPELTATQLQEITEEFAMCLKDKIGQ